MTSEVSSDEVLTQNPPDGLSCRLPDADGFTGADGRSGADGPRGADGPTDRPVDRPPVDRRPLDRHRVDRQRVAVDAARQRARGQRRRYAVVLGVCALVLAAMTGRVWQTSEIRAVTSITTTITPRALPSGDPAATLAPAWTSSDHLAVGSPAQRDVIVTYSAHTVNGRDASTGAVRWSYTRSDRRICSVAAQDGTAVAIYAHDGNCDEVTGLSAATGARTWVRTLFTDGTDLTVTAQPGYVLIAAPGSLDLIEPTGGLDWWFDTPPAACTNRAAVLGSAGVLIDSACGSGDTLSLRTLGGTDRAWTVPLGARSVLAADTAVLVLSADRRSAQRIDPTKGTVLSAVALGRTVEPAAHPKAALMANSSVEVVAVANGSLGFNPTGTAILWQRSDIGVPVEFGDALLAPTSEALLGIDPGSGRTTSTRSIEGAPVGGGATGGGLVPAVSTATAVTVLGPLVLLSADRTTMLH